MTVPGSGRGSRGEFRSRVPVPRIGDSGVGSTVWVR